MPVPARSYGARRPRPHVARRTSLAVARATAPLPYDLPSDLPDDLPDLANLPDDLADLPDDLPDLADLPGVPGDIPRDRAGAEPVAPALIDPPAAAAPATRPTPRPAPGPRGVPRGFPAPGAPPAVRPATGKARPARSGPVPTASGATARPGAAAGAGPRPLAAAADGPPQAAPPHSAPPHPAPAGAAPAPPDPAPAVAAPAPPRVAPAALPVPAAPGGAGPASRSRPPALPPLPPNAAVPTIHTSVEDLLKLARHGLAEATAATTPAERFASAHLAALRGAAAVIAARAVPSAAPGRRTRPVSAWVLLASIAPELAEWAAFFAAGAPKRANAEARLPGAVTAREADDLLRDAETFLAVVETKLGGAARPSLLDRGVG